MDAGVRFNRKVIKVAEAQKIISDYIRPLGTESVDLLQSFGRRLAVDITATHDVPHFIKSGMDGYAVRAEDLRGATVDYPAVLKVNQTIPCGTVPSKPLFPGEASRIMTGAPLPEGADTVVMLEMTEDRGTEKDWEVLVKKEIAKGRNVSAVGEEMRRGDLILEAGRKIRAGETALLASFGYATVPVYRRPKVGIFTTGSELLPVDAPIEPGKIRNSNSYMLAVQIHDAGGEPVLLGRVTDDPQEVRRKLTEAVSQVDLLITTGGVSVGDFDVMAELFRDWVDQLLFNKVAMRPGSPTTAGIFKGKLLIGLSGNPSACFVGFELFVRQILWGMQGRRSLVLPCIQARLACDYSKGNVYERYVRGSLSVENGTVWVKPVGMDQSSHVQSIKDAECLIIIPPGGRGAAREETVTTVLLPAAE